MRPYNPRLKPLARTLRSVPTDAERRLWRRIRREQILGTQFFRQRPLGNYVVDFYAPTARLVVEVDGSQHFGVAGKRRDQQPTAYLEGLGLRVLRFDNLQVLLETNMVVEVIWRAVEAARGNPV